jgi:hypothetical protein
MSGIQFTHEAEEDVHSLKFHQLKNKIQVIVILPSKVRVLSSISSGAKKIRVEMR